MHNSKEVFSFKNPVFRYNADIFAICAALSAVGIYHWGIYALWQILICSATAVLCEAVSFKAVLKKNTLSDLSALTTGMIIALLLPVSAPFYVGISASAFAVLAAKLPFGDVRNAPFFPAAAGFCFAAMMFTDAVFTYPASGSEFAFFGSEGFVKGETVFDMLSKGNSLSLNVFGRISLLSGSYPGAIGTTSMLVLAGGFGYMAIRHPKRLFTSAGYLLSAAVFAFLFPRVNSGRMSSVIIELCAGGLIFVSLLLITDPVTSPRKPVRAFLYGLTGGAVCMLLRYFSKTPDAACFSILITNALWPAVTGETILTKKTAEKYKKPLMKKKEALKRKAGTK
ncbi:MAG: RnfABCDGE type electron transport complex subunit D [Clostridia bacterium]|nr:RnfABCDGE type electron transport complex subunit D [Clostridia bacterium]